LLIECFVHANQMVGEVLKLMGCPHKQAFYPF